MNSADILANRPFVAGPMGAPMPQSPYANLMKDTLRSIETFRSKVPRPGGSDGMQPLRSMQRQRALPPPHSLNFGFDMNQAQHTRRRPPGAQGVRSAFGG